MTSSICVLKFRILVVSIALLLRSSSDAFLLQAFPYAPTRRTCGNHQSLQVAAEGNDVSSSDTTIPNSNNEDDAPTTTNLYDILGASPDDSKAELKRKYVALAKQTHPDAVGGAVPSNNLEFSEIAAAYRILSDSKQRKRYDRQIKAEAFSKELSTFAGDVAEKAAPQVMDMLEGVAIPFLRRTTATTLASFQAAAKEIRQEENNGQHNNTTTDNSADLGRALSSAMKAAQNAGQIVDNLELMEKSEVLESQVLDSIQEAKQVEERLTQTSLRRVVVALQTPNASFTASDASSLLQFTNLSSTFLERAKLKNTVDRKIQGLESAEQSLDDKEEEWEAATRLYRESESNLQKARADKVLALQAEKRAREALVRAQRKVAESKVRLQDETKSLSQAEVAMEKIGTERQKVASGLVKLQEDVRKSMLGRKEVSDALKEEQVGEENENLQELEEQEAALVKEYSRLEVAASQLQDRANKLRERAEQLKGTQ